MTGPVPHDTDAGRASAEVLVGVVVRVHGLRGEVVVDARTDSPIDRFAPGSVLRAVRRSGTGPATLTVSSARPHSGRWLVLFDGVGDRDGAEALRGVQLLLPTAELDTPADPEEFHVHQLTGLRAELTDGTGAGTVVDVVHGPGGSLLVVRRPAGHDALVPFVGAIVPTVDLEGGRVVLDPPDGLLDPVED
ncbi:MULTISPECIES: ribosome maturation factor RimM [Pseudonocardia]|uniref:Ribosome maturation factor RimM n=2 Tax=Pseudonocardia TaxID=1847 RepID=A0A1Y2N1D9_PSEAH|nr:MULTISPECIES: ribosome maturation factor RimM [Pseudonocardia]OSY41212.1 Ribosome maturation factor RimM [Pseudonocardia autotrophica]TDN76668.1 16S rRNA processing protein RimM [Pseudonocardia autotrophica]BBG00668.1 ribosome maturation factor RimM [Pseudonocardia autotrophica]GEC24366.1 ribosome maturation factor RimM [Pseudonocardia saturnea]